MRNPFLMRRFYSMSSANLGRITIHDVAAAASVSIATASKALNDTGRMATETRARIKRVAQELGFRPNALARSLLSKRSFTVGLLTNDTYGRFTLPVMAGISEGLIDHGVSVFLCAIEDNPELAKLHVEAMLDKQVDGIIATGRRIDRALPVDLSHLPVPVVYALVAGPEDAVALVPDDRQGARDAVNHLIAKNRKKLVHVTGPAHLKVVEERIEAFRDVLAVAGMTVTDAEILTGAWSEQWGREAVDKLWAGSAPPDGIFCGNDQIARGAIDALREKNVKVPQDVSVVGFDNWEIVAEQTRPPLTTVDMNLKELGRRAGQALVRLVNGEAVEAGILKLPCTLVVRGS
jgi:LacI family transcriptional regulator